MESWVLQVEGMSCTGCEQRIGTVLRRVEGAADLVERLATGPTRSYTAIRTLLKAWSGGGITAADSIFLDVTMPLHGSVDARSGRAARVEALKNGTAPERPVFVGR